MAQRRQPDAGEACRIAEPGFFRLCYAAESGKAVEVAIERLGRVLGVRT